MCEIFFFKNHVENDAGRLVLDFSSSKKLYMKWKQVVGTLVSISFASPQFGHTVKTNCMKL